MFIVVSLCAPALGWAQEAPSGNPEAAPVADAAPPVADPAVAPGKAPAPGPDVVSDPALMSSKSAELKRYDSKFSEIEEKIGRIKEEVFGSKTRLMLLREQVLHNVVAESRLVVVHDNDMGMGFTLDRVIYYLDNGKIYFAENDSGQLDDKDRFVIYDGTIVPGNHILSVEMVYSGSGGLFSYVSGYKFTVKSNFMFFASKGKILQINATGYQKGGFGSNFEDKPAVKYRLKQVRYTKENLDSLMQDL